MSVELRAPARLPTFESEIKTAEFYGERSSVLRQADRGIGPSHSALPPHLHPNRSRPRRGLGDGEREALGEAGVAPVVHVQPVGGDERRERQMVGLVPVKQPGFNRQLSRPIGINRSNIGFFCNYIVTSVCVSSGHILHS